ncbi:MAG: radical SAM protein [Candidatus Omnitrophota bacterium]
MRYKKVLLINPPDSSLGRTTDAPLGLMYIAAVLREKKIQVHILDAFLDGWNSVLPKLKEYQPDIVGIACQTYARLAAIKTAKMIKDNFDNIAIILGGHHPTLMGHQLLDNYPFIDMVCMGEGEYLMAELCTGQELEHILGLGFRKDKNVFINAARVNIDNLDILPFPAWDLVNPKRYSTHNNFIYNGINLGKEAGAGISFSRGCIGRCTFCSNNLMWKKWKHRSPIKVVDEIEYLNQTYNIRCFQFNDDCFSVNKKATIELCNEIIKRSLKIIFSIITRADCVDEVILKSLKEAGCHTVSFGIETAAPALLQAMKKPIKLEISAKAINLVNSFNIRSTALLIAGCPGENWETVNTTIDFLKKANPSSIEVANGLKLFPGTELYNMAKRDGIINDKFWLSDYHWKIYTKENSRLKLNIFANAIQNRKKLSKFLIINLLRNHKFVTKEIELFFKDIFINKIGIGRPKKNRLKPKAAY